MKRALYFLAASTFVLVLGQAQAEKDGKGGPCKAEMKKICGDIKAGGGRIAKCLKENKDKFSAECREKFQHKMEERKEGKAERKEERKELKAACHGDIEKFCSAAEEMHEKMKCLRENKEKVSEGCRKELKEMKELKGSKFKRED